MLNCEGQIKKNIVVGDEYSSFLVDCERRMMLETEGLELNVQSLEETMNFLKKDKSLAQYYVKLNEKNEPIGCGMIEYENEETWIFQTGYIEKEYRRKGVGAQFFQFGLELARKKNIRKIKLYVGKGNYPAIEMYKKFKLYINGEQIYEYELFFSEPPHGLSLHQEIPKEFTFKDFIEQKELTGLLQNMQPFLKRLPECKDHQLICEKDGKVVSYCEYSNQFSSWRCGINISITSLYIREGQAEEVMKMIFRYLYQNCKLRVGTLRFYLASADDLKFLKIAPKGQFLPVHVMQLDL